VGSDPVLKIDVEQQNDDSTATLSALEVDVDGVRGECYF